MLTFPLGSGQDELRRDGIETIEAIRRVEDRAAGIVDGPRPLERELRAQARDPPRAQQRVPARVPRGRARRRHRARGPHHPDAQDRRPRPRGHARPRLRPAAATATTRCTRCMALFEGVEAGEIEREDRSGWTDRGAALAPHHRRRARRHRGRARRGAWPAGARALSIINDVLLEGMKVVGDLFGRGEMQLPFVLQSAETMKTAVAYLEPHLEKDDAGGKGVVVIGTVKGDVHDIGKNLVDIILTNNGYEVHNIGIKAPLQTFVDKAKEVSADAIGMSGLLVKSTIIMRENLLEMNDARSRRDAGAARRRRAHAQLRRGRPARGLRGPPVLRQGRVRGSPHDGHPDDREEDRARSIPISGARRAAASCRRARARAAGRGPVDVPARSDVADDVPIFTPPFLGARVAKGISLDEIAGLHQRDRAVPQPVAVPARGRRVRRRVQGPHPPHAARRARRCEVRGLARPRGRVGLLPGQRRRRRPRGLDRRRPHHRAVPVPLPAPAQGTVPLHRRLLPQRRLGRRRLRRVPRGHRRLRGDGDRSASCSRRTSTRTTCCATASRWR